jgi:hypothetical protein
MSHIYLHIRLGAGEKKAAKLNHEIETDIGMEAATWALFVNNLIFLLISLSFALFVYPPAVNFIADTEAGSDPLMGSTTPDPVEATFSESTLEKIWLVGCAISVVAPSYILSLGISIL